MKKIVVVGSGDVSDDLTTLIRKELVQDFPIVVMDAVKIRELIDEDEDEELAEIQHIVLDPFTVDYSSSLRIAHSCGIHVDNNDTMYFQACVWIVHNNELRQL